MAPGVSGAEAEAVAVFEGGEEVVLAGVDNAAMLDGWAGCSLQPANTIKIESPMRNRNTDFNRTSIFYP